MNFHKRAKTYLARMRNGDGVLVTQENILEASLREFAGDILKQAALKAHQISQPGYLLEKISSMELEE